MTLRERIEAKVRVDPETGCWRWQAALNQYGYGVVGISTGKTGLAHRAAYTLWVGPIPAGLDLDHLCRVRSCVNPAHVEPVDRRTNLLRGETFNARNAAKTHCPSGHPYSGENLVLRDRGRRCRKCELAHKRESSRRSRARAKLLGSGV